VRRDAPLRVFFQDESRGWLLCGRKQVYSTADGGRSWQLLAASRAPDLPEDRTLYSGVVFGPQTALITGWSRPPGRRSALPAWMEPDAAPLGVRPTAGIVLHSADDGHSWSPLLLRRRGEIVRVRLSADGTPFLLLRRPDSLSVPTEIATLDLSSHLTHTVYAEKTRWIADFAFAGRRILAAAIDQEGRTAFPTIPARLKVLVSEDARQWSEMEVDYRAEAQTAILAVPDASRAWIATDTGMILHWKAEQQP
jgi:photosystem II stability/assembly factor-like uncharacterized protein